MKRKIVPAVFVLAVLFLKAGAQNFWTKTNEASLTARNGLFTSNYKPASFIPFQLDEAAFKKQLTAAPSEKSIAAGISPFIVFVPNSAGKTERFKVVEAPVMEPQLAAEYNTIKTYAGKGIDEPTSSIRFDITPEGFHGMILSAVRKTIYINPVDRANNIYIVFDREGQATPNQVFDCKTQQLASSDIQGTTAKNANDGKLRTFRFAVASGGEFSKLFLNGSEHGDSAKKAKVFAGLVTNLVRVNGIFETDLGIRLQYVNKEDSIIFLDAKNDPFLSSLRGANGTWNKQSQTAIDSLIGPKNYDIGHLLMGFSTGGDAGCIGCICINKQKGSGFTGSETALGDPFVVDYWIHEIGHQLGAFHTFDYSDEDTEAQMEPGSGSTIMSYAGVADAGLNIQFHSDPYYHAISIQEITGYVQTGKGAGCAVVSNTTNHVPTAAAGADYTVPALTPFKLTGKAIDGDVTDVLTYCWEEFDDFNLASSNALPKSTSKTGPVFRTFSPDTSASRIFPGLLSILNGANKNKWEVLPGLTRKLHFRFTVRDNQPGHGSNNSGDMAVTVDSASGPFRVKIPNTAVTWLQGSKQTVKWDVANTNNAPVSCGNVDILLSADGGQTFPYILLAAKANNGSASVILPAISCKQCRIMVKANSNIFFDISDVDFTISNTLPVNLISFTALPQKQDVILKWVTENEINNDHFDIEKSSDNIRYGSIGLVAAANNPPAVQHTYSFIDNNAYGGTVYYRLKQVDKDGAFIYSHIATVNINFTNVLWQVYPNPAGSKTSVHIKAAISAAQLQLSDAKGQVVYAKDLSELTPGRVIEIPLQNLAKGVYLLKIQAGKESRVEKIIVE